MPNYAQPMGLAGAGAGGVLGGLSSAVGVLDKPRQWLWSALGLPEQGNQLVSQLTGLDPDSAISHVLGFGANMLGDPLTYAGGALGKLLGGAAGKGLEAAAVARGPEFATAAEDVAMHPGWLDAMSGPHAEQLAREIPPGSTFLGRGAEASVLKTPQNTAIRLARVSNRTPKPGAVSHAPGFELAQDPLAIPEMLQPMRHVQAGPYRLTHSPLIDTLAPQVDQLIGSATTRAELNGHQQLIDDLTKTYDQAGQAMAERLKAQGMNPWDVHGYNVGRTGDDQWVVHDSGSLSDAPASVPRVESVPLRQPDRLTNAILSMLGSPQSIRQEIARPLLNQGVNLGIR